MNAKVEERGCKSRQSTAPVVRSKDLTVTAIPGFTAKWAYVVDEWAAEGGWGKGWGWDMTGQVQGVGNGSLEI